MLNFSEFSRWPHHRSGWSHCVDLLMPFHNESGISVVSSVETSARREALPNKPWIGFAHHPPHIPACIEDWYEIDSVLDMNRLFDSDYWASQRRNCKGLICVSSESARFARRFSGCPAEFIRLGTAESGSSFRIDEYRSNRRLVHFGHWLRDFRAFFEVDSGKIRKTIYRLPKHCVDFDRVIDPFRNDNTDVHNFVSPEEYDRVLDTSVVFQNLLAATANNIVVDCIAKQTPLIINRLPAVEDYLGRDYPLYYDEISEVRSLLEDERIEQCCEYHRNHPEIAQSVTGDAFLKAFLDCPVVRPALLI